MEAEDIRVKLRGNEVLPIGMRGTSYEMVIQLFEKGVLTGDPTESKRRGGTYIYIWPIRENWEAYGLSPPAPWGKNYWDPVRSSKDFAIIHTRHDHFERECGFPIGEYERWLNNYEDIRRKIKSAMTERGLTDSDIAKLIKETKMRKGYILEFHPDLARDYALSPDDWFGKDYSVAFQVDCPNGVGIKYVSKIKPIGKFDEELMKKYLRERKVHESRALQ